MPVSPDGMSVSDAGIKRRLRESATDSCAVIAVRASGGEGSLLEAVVRAVAAANAAATQPGEALVHGNHVFGSGKDALFYLVSDGPIDDVRAWLAVVSRALERGGWRGKVLAPSNSSGPEASWRFRDNHIPWNATLGVTLPRRTNRTMLPGWPAGDGIARDVLEFARDWVGAAHGSKYLMHGASQIQLAETPPPDLMVSALKRSSHVTLTTLGRSPHIMRAVDLGWGGRVTFSVKGVDEHWRTSIAAARDALLRFGSAADCGWVAYGGDCVTGHEGRLNSARRDGLEYREWENNRHLWASYLPEVFGIQVVTKAHLDRATDLRDWKLTALGHERYLLEANDLEEWYSQPTPYTTARAFGHYYFGDMILTRDSIRADEHGWLRGDGPPPSTEL